MGNISPECSLAPAEDPDGTKVPEHAPAQLPASAAETKPRAPKRRARPKQRRPLSIEEKFGHIWGIIYILFLLILAVTLFGKGCLFSG